MKPSWILLLIILVGWNMCKIKAEKFDECEGVTMLTFVASSKDCSKYIFCDGDDSYEGDCDDGDYFNPLYQTCDAQEMVQCRFDSNSTNINEDQTTTIVATTTSYTTDEIMTSESVDFLFMTTTTTTATTTTTTTTTAATYTMLPTTSIIDSTTTQTTIPTITNTVPFIWTVATPAKGETCPQIADPYRIFYIKNSLSCSDYLICYRGLSIKMHCAPMLHFNAATGKCDYPELAKCNVDLLAPAREQCQSYTNDYYPHESNCNYFYHCKSGFLFLEHCPFGYGWDYEKRVCTKVTLAKCHNKRYIVNTAL